MTTPGTLLLGTRLRRYRVATRLTQAELAERTGVSARTICDLERGLPRRWRHDTISLLAAARVKLFGPAALLLRLDLLLALLTGGAQDLPERQHTLEHAIVWSYDLITEQERALFRRLAIFVAGWTIEAAKFVCGDPDADPDAATGG
jgi:predicted ATPase